MRDGPALFVSPHYDDVALSCGATVARLAEAGEAPAVITVFASEVLESMVGEAAAVRHARWKIRDHAEVSQRRREEDAAAARILGCAVRWLGVPDAIYRERYPDDARLYGQVHPEEEPLPSHLADELRGLPEWRAGNAVFVPLAVGRHVDHQLCFELGRVLAQQGEQVFAYEDVPYAIHTPAGVTERLAEVAASLGDCEQVPVAATLARRIAAIAQYGSQLPVIFRFTDDFAAAVEGHARAVGGALGPCERFWPVLR